MMFVWTISDVINLALLVLALVIVGGVFAVAGLDKLWRRVRRWWR